MIKKLSDLIVNKRKFVLVAMLILAIASVFASQFVEINEDMTKYLPDDSRMKAGLDIMEEEFPVIETSNSIRVMFDNLTDSQKETVLDKLSAITYVDSVDYDAESDEYNKDNHTLYILNISCEYNSEEEQAIEAALEAQFADYRLVWKNNDSGFPGISLIFIATALSVLLAILFIMCGSWIEPLLFLVVIGVAVVINSGTNIVLGSVASITNSIAAILQLVLSMDYSIILMNSYRQEKERETDNIQAMKNALAYAFSSVASSSLTTVVGLIMLAFMSFKIGANLGIVLAKGVFISMVCVITMLPGIILACNKLIQKTAKKTLHIPTIWAAKFSHKMRYVMLGLFVVLFIGAYILQQQTGIAYTLADEDEIADIFPTDNTVVMVYENQDENNLVELITDLEEDENIKSVMGYGTILGKPYTSAELAKELELMSQDISLDSSIIDMLYYDYYIDDKIVTMTASEFLSFISDTVMNDETFSDYIDDDMKENMDMLDKFTDAQSLVTPMNANQLAEFFDMDAERIKDLFLLYYIENGNVSTGSMTLAAFADFVINEVANDSDYSSMFDASALSQLKQLATFTDATEMTTPYTYTEIASLLGMDSDTTRLLFVYYYAMSDSYDPGTMTISEFVNFLQNDIANDPTFSSYLDESTMEQIETLALFTDKTAVQAQRSPAKVSSMLEIDEALVETIFILSEKQDVSDKTMTLADFTTFLTGNSMFSSSFDEDTKTQLQLIQLAASGQEFTAEAMANMMGMDTNTISRLYFLYFSQDADFQNEIANMTMSLTDFLNLLKANSTEEQQAQLTQMEQLISLASSDKTLSAEDLASITGISEEQVNAIFASKDPVVDTMTLPEFLNTALQLSPDNAQLNQLNQIVQLAASDTALDIQTLLQVFGIQEAQVKQLFGLKAISGKSLSLSEFTGFLVNNVLKDEAYKNNFTAEQQTQLDQLNQIVQLAASGTALDTQTLAQTFGLEEEMIESVFRLAYAAEVSDKTMSMEEIVDFILDDPVMNSYMDSKTLSQLSMMQQMIKAAVDGTKFTYKKLSDLLGMDSTMLKMLYTVKASERKIYSWSLSMHTIINFLVNNSDMLSSMLDSDQISSLSTAQAIINGSVSGTLYNAGQIADLMGMSNDQAQQLYLLYTRQHGDISGWILSVQGFIDFIIDDILPNSKYADKIDADTSEMLSSGRTMVDAVVSGKTYTASEMGQLLSELTDGIDSSMVDLLYLYAESSENADPKWTMNLETLFNYMIHDVLADPRFESVIDADMRQTLLDAQDTLDEGRAQLVTKRYSRLIITSAYPEESDKTTDFFASLEQYCDNNLNGEYYLVGNSAMNYEMQQTFDNELLFITALTALAIFIIVAFTFKSLSIPLILVLLVQCGVYITITITGYMSGSMYYLALLIVECILMGATVDYGILFTNYYCDARRTADVKEALKEAYAGSIHTILTSGLILILVTAVVGGMFENPTVTAIVKTISMGSLCATILILFVLPGVLAACDKIVTKKRDRV